MQLTGSIVTATAIETVSDSFKKRNLILKIDEDTNYPQEINIELHQNNVELIKGMVKGDQITVDVNLRGRPWANKEGVTVWFNTIVAWKVTKIGAGSAPVAAAAPVAQPVAAAAPTPTDDDDLPF